MNSNQETMLTKIQEILLSSFSYHQAGDLCSALEGYNKILSLDENHVEALQLSGALARQQNRYEDAISLIDRAIKLNPHVPVFYFNLAETYSSINDYENAEKYYREALKIDPDHIDSSFNLGLILLDQASFEESLKLLNTVVTQNPKHDLGRYNIARCYRYLGQISPAFEHCQECLRINPSHIDANLLMAELLLCKGHFSEGWAGYEWRRYQVPYKAKAHHSVAPFPRWDGSPLEGKRILLQAEQGVGDEIMFAAYVPTISRVAADCLLECDPRFIPLFSRSFPDVTVVPKMTLNSYSRFLKNGPVDWRITVGSLPKIVKSTGMNFERQGRYLYADSLKYNRWMKLLDSTNDCLKVGISWRGGRDTAEQSVRSIPLSLWTPILAIPDIDFINLQYGEHSSEILKLENNEISSLRSFQKYDPLVDLDDAAALIANLDLVITVDNTTAHLAGALGVPVWLLLPAGANWRWLQGCKDSYWYKSLRIFQQESFGKPSWQRVVSMVATSLSSFFPGIGGKKNERTITVDTGREHTDTYVENKKALFVNDTSSWYHWGCSCTSIAIHQELRERGYSVTSLPIGTITDSLSVPTSVEDFDSDGFWEYYKERHGKVIDEIKKSNVIVVNGEGSLHGLAPLPLKLLYLMYIAKKRLNTSTYLLNHSCYPDEDKKLPAGLGAFLYKKVYTEIDFCGIREIKSSQILRELGLAITDTFDCLPLYIERNFTSAIEGDENSIVIAGSVFIDDGVLSILSTCIDNLSSRGYKIKLLIGADAFPAADDLRFFSALKRMCPDSFQLINANSEKEWLATIDQARLLISGRFHHSIAAAFLKTPFVALQTNTPKLDALLEMLSLPWKLSVTDNNASELLMEMVDLLLLSPGRGIVDDSVCDELKRRSLVNFIDL